MTNLEIPRQEDRYPIRGYFRDNHAPYITVHVIVESLDLQSHIDFLIATGSTVTTLMPHDAGRLRVDYQHPDLHYREISHRPGLRVQAAPVPARIAFLPAFGDPYYQDIELNVAQPGPDVPASPSIMGIDALWNMRLEINPEEVLLTPAEHIPKETQ